MYSVQRGGTYLSDSKDVSLGLELAGVWFEVEIAFSTEVGSLLHEGRLEAQLRAKRVIENDRLMFVRLVVQCDIVSTILCASVSAALSVDVADNEEDSSSEEEGAPAGGLHNADPSLRGEDDWKSIEGPDPHTESDSRKKRTSSRAPEFRRT